MDSEAPRMGNRDQISVDVIIVSLLMFQIFRGNSERYTVVRQNFDESIITRYIRIHPETWSNAVSMRAEFYGCRTGGLNSL